jgi:hypothetical protein
MSSCTALDDAVLKWTLAKRKIIVKQYSTSGGSAFAHAALLGDVPADDVDSLPTLEDCTDEYSVPFIYVAFSSFITMVVTSRTFG